MSNRKDARLSNSARGTTSKRLVNGNRPPEGEPWIWVTEEMLLSPAMRSLSKAARQVLDRLKIEHMAHAGTENGNLICTHKDLSAHGVRYPSIAAAIRELEYMGFIRVQKGRMYRGEHEPSRYRLTWLPVKEGQSANAASNEWKSITDQHVEAFKRQKREDAKAQRLTKSAIRKRKLKEAGSNVVELNTQAGAHD